MEITQKVPEKTYPYLAVMIELEDINSIQIDDIMIVSMVSEKTKEDPKPYVQYLNGNKAGWFTKTEKDYVRLPNGFSVNLTQK